MPSWPRCSRPPANGGKRGRQVLRDAGLDGLGQGEEHAADVSQRFQEGRAARVVGALVEAPCRPGQARHRVRCRVAAFDHVPPRRRASDDGAVVGRAFNVGGGPSKRFVLAFYKALAKSK